MTEETKLQKTTHSDVPAFISQDEDAKQANELLSQYVQPPRMKIVQPTTKPPLSERFSPGDLLLMPSETLVANRGEPFLFTPLFFFPEWITVNPLGSDQFIRERTYDPESDLATKARDPKRRKEPCPEDASKTISHRESLVFIVALHLEEFAESYAALSFARAEHKKGTALASSIKMSGVPMYGTIWEGKVSQRSNAEGQWFGVDTGPPHGTSRFVQDKELYEKYKAAHADFRDAYLNNKIKMDSDEEELTEPLSQAF